VSLRRAQIEKLDALLPADVRDELEAAGLLEWYELAIDEAIEAGATVEDLRALKRIRSRMLFGGYMQNVATGEVYYPHEVPDDEEPYDCC
jgi:hypothetical protein